MQLLEQRAEELLGPRFLEELHASSKRILELGIPPSELSAVARGIRDDAGGFVRGEMRLMGGSGVLSTHTSPAVSAGIADKLLDSMPHSLLGFIRRDCPLHLDHATDRLIHFTAISYVLDHAAMNFQPKDPSDSKACDMERVDELSKKLVLICGPTAVGKGAVRRALLKDLLGIGVKRDIIDKKLFKMAESAGIAVVVKLTGRERREDEEEGVDYWYFDGKEQRPPEERLIKLCQGRNVPYSYTYHKRRYAFAWDDIHPEQSGKKEVITGLREKLEDPSVRMILCGGGTTPEAMYFRRLFTNATVIYLVPTPTKEGLLPMEQELIHRWWGRTIGEKIAKPITAGIGAFRRGVGGAMEHGDLGDVRAAILDAPRTLQWAYDVLGADAITFSENVEAELKGRLTEVTPQLAQALMVGPRMGFNIVENVRGRLDETVKQIKELLGGRGLIEESY